ncbi:T9SS type A sorting domain-containing protein, partial [Candidatus Fermentibacteria bacterium]|nr:T9SS type A sorting domain-containing protein [Candidatus Fermentibacteria bacterium]
LEDDYRQYYCTIQLPQGGYMAAGAVYGGGAYLARYAPETGIGEESPGSESPLLQVGPNPFCSYCAVSFELSRGCVARLELYDLSGRLVDTLMDGHVGAGSHEARIEGSGLAPGVYLLRLRAEDQNLVRRVVLVR